MIKLPILIVDKSGLHEYFDDIASAENSLEVIDVNNNEYCIYDASGKKLSTYIKKESMSFLFGLTTIEVDCVKIIEN